MRWCIWWNTALAWSSPVLSVDACTPPVTPPTGQAPWPRAISDSSSLSSAHHPVHLQALKIPPPKCLPSLVPPLHSQTTPCLSTHPPTWPEPASHPSPPHMGTDWCLWTMTLVTASWNTPVVFHLLLKFLGNPQTYSRGLTRSLKLLLTLCFLFRDNLFKDYQLKIKRNTFWVIQMTECCHIISPYVFLRLPYCWQQEILF